MKPAYVIIIMNFDAVPSANFLDFNKEVRHFKIAKSFG